MCALFLEAPSRKQANNFLHIRRGTTLGMSIITKKLTLDEALDDVEARFLYNLPQLELRRSDRLFFQIEQAHWFYEDFIADQYTHLPHYKLKSFAEKIFSHCSLFEGDYQNIVKYFPFIFKLHLFYRYARPVRLVISRL